MALEPEDTELDMYADAWTEWATGKTMAILKEKFKSWHRQNSNVVCVAWK